MSPFHLIPHIFANCIQLGAVYIDMSEVGERSKRPGSLIGGLSVGGTVGGGWRWHWTRPSRRDPLVGLSLLYFLNRIPSFWYLYLKCCMCSWCSDPKPHHVTSEKNTVCLALPSIEGSTRTWKTYRTVPCRTVPQVENVRGKPYLLWPASLAKPLEISIYFFALLYHGH